MSVLSIQKKILYFILILSALISVCLSFLVAPFLSITIDNFLLLRQSVVVAVIICATAYMLVKNQPRFFLKSSVLETADSSFSFDIYSSTLGNLAKITLAKLDASYLEIKVKHSREEGQLFAFYYASAAIGSHEKPELHQLNFQLGASFVAEMSVALPVFDQKLKSYLNTVAAQFSYVLSKMIFSSEHSRFVELSEQTLKAKTGFLANLSHEVRAPLGVILNATELVLDGLCGEINDNQKKFLSLSKKSSDHLLDLINDVLDFAKIEAGKVNPVPKSISVSETLRDVLNMLRLLAENKHIEVDSDEVDNDLVVLFDKKHFRQILINLATNAVKYTQEKGTIHVWTERVATDHLKICIKDSGVGIAKNQRHKVFRPFERLEEEYSKQQSGVGIGLSLAKRLAEMNNASLDFQSEPGQGSVFFLIAPLSADLTDADKSSNSIEQVKSHGETIAIIEPDSEQSEIIAKYLEDLGYNILKFINTAEAEVQINNIDLLILDNQIFDEQLKSVKDLQVLKDSNFDLPVILLSSRAFIFDLERYLKAGVERCLPKPAPLKELAALCREVLNRKSQLGRTSE